MRSGSYVLPSILGDMVQNPKLATTLIALELARADQKPFPELLDLVSHHAGHDIAALALDEGVQQIIDHDARLFHSKLANMGFAEAAGHYVLWKYKFKPEMVTGAVSSIFKKDFAEALKSAEEAKARVESTSLAAAIEKTQGNRYVCPPLLLAYAGRLMILREASDIESNLIESMSESRSLTKKATAESVALKSTQLSDRFPVAMVADEIYQFLNRLNTPRNIQLLSNEFAKAVSADEFANFTKDVVRTAIYGLISRTGDADAKAEFVSAAKNLKPQFSKLIHAIEKILVDQKLVSDTPVIKVPDIDLSPLSHSHALVVR